MQYCFFIFESHEEKRADSGLGEEYSCELWKPSLFNIVPPGSPFFFAVWWVMHYLHAFANRDYCIMMIYADEALVHRSCVFPKYFRFPFMGQRDLQIGDTWTEPHYRGRGLATHALRQIVGRLQKPGRKFWYLVEQDNIASIRVIEKAGFELVGKGSRTKRFGIRALGAYVIGQQISAH